MVNVSLSDREVEILLKSINHCMQTCEEGGPKDNCPDCQSLRGVLDKLSE